MGTFGPGYWEAVSASPTPPAEPPFSADGEKTVVSETETIRESGIPPADGEHVVITEDETIRDLGDGNVAREGVRVEQRRRRPVDPIAVALVAILVLLAAAGATWWVLSKEDSRTVPSVEGLALDRATARVEEKGLTASVERRASEEQQGTVIEQSPTAGTDADKGSTVRLVVSAGPSTVAVPNAVGLSETEARDRMVAGGFEVASRQVFADRDAGTVVSQSPAAGTKVAKGDRVELVVSKGDGLVDVPSLVGLSRAEAEAQLSSAKLEANVVEVPSSEPAGTVVAQSPPSGQLRQGEAVRLNVSSGA